MRTTTPFAGFACCFAILAVHSDAHAGECAPPTPACHLANGSKLLKTDPKRAAEELLASFNLDERTDTLALYAMALQLDRQYARALETWQRIIVFRESEIEAAKEALRTGSRRKREAARAAAARAQEQSELAAEAIMKLWPRVARVRIVMAPGQRVVVSHNGFEVDTSRDVLVNADGDELTFTRADGSVERLAVEVAAGQTRTIEAPSAEPEQVAALAPKPRARPQARPRAKPQAQSREARLQARPQAKSEAKLTAKLPARPPRSVIETPEPELSASQFARAPRSRTMSRVGLGLAAGGVVGLGIAGTLGYLADRDFDRAQGLGCSAGGQCPIGAAADLGARSNDRARAAQITAIGGGALLVTGATLWILGRGKTRRAVTDVTVSVGPSSVGIGWSLK